MLMDILMESLMSMDEDTLNSVLESCSDEEIELIDDMVTEATQPMSAQDKEDFNTIERIQRKARSSGWGEVPKEDRDKFVDIMSHSKNLGVLKKAKTLGEREASHDSKIKNALKNLGASAAGAAIGAGVAFDKSESGQDLKDQYYSYKTGTREIRAQLVDKLASQKPDEIQALMQSEIDSASADADGRKMLKHLGIRPGTTVAKSNYSGLLKKFINGSPKLDAAYKYYDSYDCGDSPAMAHIKSAIGNIGWYDDGGKIAAGAVAGAAGGIAARAAIKGVANKIRYEKDKKAVISQGDAMHPDAQWKYNRKYGK